MYVHLRNQKYRMVGCEFLTYLARETAHIAYSIHHQHKKSLQLYNCGVCIGYKGGSYRY